MSWFQHFFLPHHTNNQRAKILHSSSLSILVLVLIVFQLGIDQVGRNFPAILGYASQISPTEVVRLTNEERMKNGLASVNLDSQLSAAAAQKASDMFARDYWAHVSPVGTQPWYFITQSGYSYRYAGENLARDFSDPGSVVTAWMNSPTHKDNLLNSKYQDVGVAVVDGKLGGQETTLVVQMFGTRIASAPAVGGTSAFTVKASEAKTTLQPVPTVAVSEVLPTPTPTRILQAYVQPLNPLSASSGGNIAQTSITNPFTLTKALSLGILGILALVLSVDLILVKKRHIVRWSSRSFAHLIFVIILGVAAATVLRGQVI
jgi:hypothetical protein